MEDRISDHRKKVNPKIAKDISNIIKPYWKLIDNSSDYYKLRTLSIEISKINIKVKKDVEVLLGQFKKAAWQKIEKKIKNIHDSDETRNYSIKNLRRFLEKNKINNIYYSALFNAIYGKMMVNLGLEDFKLITKNAKKAKFYSFGVSPVDKADALLKQKLKGMDNAILILTGNEETTLDELDFVWTNVLKYLPKNGKTAFAYKIDGVKKLQLDLLAVG